MTTGDRANWMNRMKCMNSTATFSQNRAIAPIGHPIGQEGHPYGTLLD
ncbi:hypothetical protein ACFY12_29135 [Streptomyces sp. NPDC001339]